MVYFRASFYKRFLGMPVGSRGTIEIRSARDRARALEAAKRKFARQHKVAHWGLRADSFVVFGPEEQTNVCIGTALAVV